MKLPLIVLGSGGHAKVLIAALKPSRAQILGFTDPNQEQANKAVSGVRWLGGDDAVLEYSPSCVYLVNGLGSVQNTDARRRLYEHFKTMGYFFANVIQNSVVLTTDDDLYFGEGTQIMAGAIIQPGCKVGENSIINTKASVDHDCRIGSHVHIAPGATLSGNVWIGDGTHIGTGAVIIQGVRIGRACIIGAGTVVLENIPDGATVVGVPGKVVKR